MKPFLLTIVVAVLAVSTANADDHHGEWIKYFAGSWKFQETGGEVDHTLVADGNATIGTGRSSDGKVKSAWIMGWDPARKRMIHQWFGVDYGRASYEVVDGKTLRGPGTIHGAEQVTKGTVTITKTSDEVYTVHWVNVTVNGQKSDDIHVTMQRK